MFRKIKQWFAIRRAKKEEKKHLTTQKELEEEHKEFIGTEKKAHDILTRKKK